MNDGGAVTYQGRSQGPANLRPILKIHTIYLCASRHGESEANAAGDFCMGKAPGPKDGVRSELTDERVAVALVKGRA